MKKLNYLFILLQIVLILFNCNWGVKDQEAPVVNYTQNFLVISPNNDGIQDGISFDISFRDQSYIRYWKLEIYDANNKVIKKFESDEKLESQIEKALLPKKNIILPKKIEWDCKDEKGNLVPDGKYTYKFITMDNKKNMTKSDVESGIIIIDTDKPEIKAEANDVIYSPNGDGNKDTMKIKVNIVKEKVDNLLVLNKEDQPKADDKKAGQVWYVDIINEKGDLVKRYTYNEKGLFDIEWDFKDEKGQLVPDGKYKIKLHSKDEGGNYWEQIQDEFVIDSTVFAIAITNVEPIISPNEDGVKDSQTFKIEATESQSIEKWSIKIMNSENKEILSKSEKGKLPQEFVWDGKDNNGKTVIDGKYSARLSAVYKNGNNPIKDSNDFIVDNTSPTATVSISPDVFSPDGNGKQDELIIKQTTTEEELWEGYITNAKNEIVKKFAWSIKPPDTELWDGKSSDNKLLDDGVYFYQLKGIDKAGNKFESKKYQTKIYTGDTPIFISASLDSFSPNKDSVKDIQTFEIKVSKAAAANEISEWKIDIKDSGDNNIFSISNKGDLPDKYEWDGMTANKSVAPDAKYTAHLFVIFKAGTDSKSKTKEFSVDTKPPSVSLTYTPSLFTPDEDGDEDFVNINIKAEDPSGINKWRLVIFGPSKKKKAFYAFEGLGQPGEKLIWDGKNFTGDYVDSVEDYPLKLYAEDEVGNAIDKDFPAIKVGILVIKLPDGRLKIRIGNIQFVADKAVMTDSEKNAEILGLLIKALSKYPKYHITIEGHANKDNKYANEKIGKKLSEQRANTIASFLIKKGIEKQRISTIGKGFDEPIIAYKEDMTKEEFEELYVNRRVEFYLSK